MPKLVECVPNISEGRDRGAIEAIAAEVRSVTGVTLLDVDPGADTNRTVYTFVGPPDAVSEAALRMARKVAALIDMSRHQGEHPRIGALDVCPIVPVSGITMDECVDVARALGRRIADELQIPSISTSTRPLATSGGAWPTSAQANTKGSRRSFGDPAWTPDCGPAVFNPRLGATVVGAREFLIAYNVNLNTRDRRLAHEIALCIRETGRLERDERRERGHQPGREPVADSRPPEGHACDWLVHRGVPASAGLRQPAGLPDNTTPCRVRNGQDEAERLGAAR